MTPGPRRRLVDSVPGWGAAHMGSLEPHGLSPASPHPQEPLPLRGPVQAGRPGSPAPQQ